MTNTNRDLMIHIAKVVEYISHGYEIRARVYFNSHFDTYAKIFDTENEPAMATEIWVLLNEYLNAEVMGDEYKEKKAFLISEFEDYVEDRKG